MTKKVAFSLLVTGTLACKFVTQVFVPPTTLPPVSIQTPSGLSGNTSPQPATTQDQQSITPVQYVPPECANKSIATIPAATTIAEPTPSLKTNPELSKERQLEVFNDLVQKIDQVYLYPDFNGHDWQAIVAEYRAKLEADLDTEAFYVQMSAMINELGDEHSMYASPVEVAEEEAELSGVNNYVGIGVLVQPLLDKKRVTILSVLPGSSAEHSGLKPHDSLLAVDGLPLVEGDTVYSQRIRGAECSALVLTVVTPGQAPRHITLIRARINAPLPIDARLVPTQDGSRIGYLFIPTFFDETIPGQVKQALENFGSLDGLIVDNRMNGGGSSDVLEPTLGYFTSGTVGNFVSRKGSRPLAIEADPVQNSQNVPLVVLVGEDTVSFGEIFSGVLQDSGRAKIAGQTTLGNVEVLRGYKFQDGSQLWIAEERFDPAVSHADWETTGIQPDLPAPADWDTFTFDNDPGIAAALQLLGYR